MKLITKMPNALKPFFQKELEQYYTYLEAGEYQTAWGYLERSHILGQAYPMEHTKVHWLMLKFGFSIKDYREIFGQLPRLLVGGIKSFVGKVPVGNTGGANVPPMQPMEISEDLLNILKQNKD